MEITTVAPRQSNIELLRILAMFFIIAHHCVVNSTLWLELDFAHPSVKSTLVQLWGMWGKTGINVFVLISGYFMCTGRLTLKRYLKLVGELIFYGAGVHLALSTLGFENFSWMELAKRISLYDVFSNPNGGFMSGFMWMYLLVPFLNAIIKGFTESQLKNFVLVLLVMFTGMGTLFNAGVFHCVFWYMTLYFIAAIIRLHPLGWMNSNRFCLPLFLCAGGGAVASIIVIDLVAPSCKMLLGHPYILVADSHKLFALLVGVLAFLVFKNLKIGYHIWINRMASTVFGVFLLHTAGSRMRGILWHDIFHLAEHYALPTPRLMLYLAFVAASVFFLFSCVDMVRAYVVRRVFPGFFTLK